MILVVLLLVCCGKVCATKHEKDLEEHIYEEVELLAEPTAQPEEELQPLPTPRVLTENEKVDLKVLKTNLEAEEKNRMVEVKDKREEREKECLAFLATAAAAVVAKKRQDVQDKSDAKN